jgi:hypothetical protein
MANGKRVYIGKGTTNKNFDTIVDVSIEMELAEDFIFTAKNGKRYLNFSVAARSAADKYGNTHGVSIWQKDVPVPTPAFEEAVVATELTPAQKRAATIAEKKARDISAKKFANDDLPN